MNYFDEIQKALNAAKSVDDIDAVWNEKADIIKTLPDQQAKALDKIYLSERDKLEKAQVTDKSGKLI